MVVDFKTTWDNWVEAQIVGKRKYSKSAGAFLDNPFDSSEDEEEVEKFEL